MGFPGGSVVKNQPVKQEMQKMLAQSLGRKDPLEKEMATHSSILAWEIPWSEEPGSLQSMGSQRVGYNLATKLSISYCKVVIHLLYSYQFSVERIQMVEFRTVYFTLGKLKKVLIPKGHHTEELWYKTVKPRAVRAHITFQLSARNVLVKVGQTACSSI